MKKEKTGAIVTGVIVLIIAVLAGLGIYTYITRNQSQETKPDASAGAAPAQQSQAPAGQGARTATAVRVRPVVKGTIENSVMLNGDVLAANQVSIFPTVAGKITGILFQVGDRVSQGTVVAMVDPSRPGQIYSESPVVSTISGTILSVPVNKGDTVSVQTPVYVVGDLSRLMVETWVPERFSNAARRLLPAEVYLEAFPGQSFPAVVEEVSPVLDPASRTLRIRLGFSGPMKAGIRAGMFATVRLVTQIHKDVPVIPKGAVINTYGSWFVFTVNDGNIASRREVSLGMENSDFIEVVNGLEPGELVVSEGQSFLTDGDPVRIVE